MHDLSWLSFSGLYLSLHFLVYVIVLRRLKPFAREDVMLLWHVLSVVILTVTALFFWVEPEQGKVAVAIGTMGLHGLYSLTFLEFWSLSDGGYSLRILNFIAKAHEKGMEAHLDELERLGSLKKEDRIQSLIALGLAEKKETRLRQAPFGQWVGSAVSAIAWLCNLPDRGGR